MFPSHWHSFLTCGISISRPPPATQSWFPLWQSRVSVVTYPTLLALCPTRSGSGHLPTRELSPRLLLHHRPSSADPDAGRCR